MLKRPNLDLAAETYDSLVNTARVSSPGDISFILGVIFQRRLLIGACTIAGLILGLIVFVVLPRNYTATAQIVIDFRRLAVIAPNEATFNYRMSDAAVQTQVAIVSSEAVLRRVVDTLDLTRDDDFVSQPGMMKRGLIALGLADDPASAPDAQRDEAVTALRKAIRSEREGISYMITITASSPDAPKAARLANAVASAYVADQQSARSSIAEQAHDWYKGRLVELQDLAGNALRTVADFRARNQIVFASGRYVEEQRLEDYSIRLLGAQNRRVIAQARLDRVQAILAQESKGGDLPTVSGGIAEELRNPIIIVLLNRYNDISRRYAENLGRYGPEHEAVKRVQGEMGEIQRAMDAELRRVAESLRSEAQITQSEENVLRDMVKELGERVTQAQKARVELDLLDGAASSYTKLRDMFVQQYSAATQQETYPVNETHLQTPASVPMRPSSPVLRRNLVGGAVLGLIVGLCAAFGRQVFDRRLRTRRQLELVTGRACLGYVAIGTETASVGSLPQQLLGSVLLNIRNNDQVVARGVVGIAGALPDHEASRISLSLAELAARTGERVLLVDLNQMTHAVSGILGSVPTKSDGTANAPDSVPMASQGVRSHPGQSNIFVLPIAPFRRSGLSREAQYDFSNVPRILEEARHHFDLVIVDLPPLAPVTSARHVTALVDCFALVVAWHAFGAQDLSDLLAAYGDVADRMIGAIYSQVDLDKAAETEDAALINTVDLLGGKREAST